MSAVRSKLYGQDHFIKKMQFLILTVRSQMNRPNLKLHAITTAPNPGP